MFQAVMSYTESARVVHEFVNVRLAYSWRETVILKAKQENILYDWAHVPCGG